MNYIEHIRNAEDNLTKRYIIDLYAAGVDVDTIVRGLHVEKEQVLKVLNLQPSGEKSVTIVKQ